MTTRDHEEVRVGGELDEARLRAIMSRGWLLRNLSVPPERAFEYEAPPLYPGSDGNPPPWSDFGGSQHTDGETPTLVWDEGDDGETRRASHEVHMGCGEVCGEFAVIPFDGDMGGVPSENARAIVHAGRDLIDLVREVVALRAQLVKHETVTVQALRERDEARGKQAHAEALAVDLRNQVLSLESLNNGRKALENLHNTMLEAAKLELARHLGIAPGPLMGRATWEKTIGVLPTDDSAYRAAQEKMVKDADDAILNLRRPSSGISFTDPTKALDAYAARSQERMADLVKQTEGNADEVVYGRATATMKIAEWWQPTGTPPPPTSADLIAAGFAAPAVPTDPEQRMSFVLERIYCCCTQNGAHPSGHGRHCPIFRTWDSLIMSWAQGFQDIADEIPEPGESPREALVRACLQLAQDSQIAREITRRALKPDRRAIVIPNEIPDDELEAFVREFREAVASVPMGDAVILVHGPETYTDALRAVDEVLAYHRDLNPPETRAEHRYVAPELLPPRHGIAPAAAIRTKIETRGSPSRSELLVLHAAEVIDGLRHRERIHEALVATAATAVAWLEMLDAQAARSEIEPGLPLQNAVGGSTPWERLREDWHTPGTDDEADGATSVESGAWVLRDAEGRVRLAVEQGGGSYWKCQVIDDHGRHVAGVELGSEASYDPDDAERKAGRTWCELAHLERQNAAARDRSTTPPESDPS